MHKDASCAWTYEVREAAPDVLLFGNLGVVQARDMKTTEIRALVDAVGADAICLHMNPAMELVQPEGDETSGGSTQSALCAGVGCTGDRQRNRQRISRQTAKSFVQLALNMSMCRYGYLVGRCRDPSRKG